MDKSCEIKASGINSYPAIDFIITTLPCFNNKIYKVSNIKNYKTFNE